MYTYEDIAFEVSKLLNDSEHCDSQYNFTRWSKSELIHYAKDAVSVIATSVPKKFVVVEIVKLQPGSTQELPKDCSKIVKVLNLADDIGASPVSSANEHLSALFPKMCSGVSSDSYKIDSVSLEPSSDRIFYVHPPVPVSEKGTELKVLCFKFPSESLEDDYEIEPWMHNMIVEWCLYRGYSSEDESSTSDQNATTHLQHFYTLIANYRASLDSLDSDNLGAINASAQANS